MIIATSPRDDGGGHSDVSDDGGDDYNNDAQYSNCVVLTMKVPISLFMHVFTFTLVSR